MHQENCQQRIARMTGAGDVTRCLMTDKLILTLIVDKFESKSIHIPYFQLSLQTNLSPAILNRFGAKINASKENAWV